VGVERALQADISFSIDLSGMNRQRFLLMCGSGLSVKPARKKSDSSRKMPEHAEEKLTNSVVLPSWTLSIIHRAKKLA
jgi:hypothetical protein